MIERFLSGYHGKVNLKGDTPSAKPNGTGACAKVETTPATIDKDTAVDSITVTGTPRNGTGVSAVCEFTNGATCVLK
ncbi:hypothetical protein [Rappaport israeli]|uniref:hypothetical protein n=1 Tax=Rappaport israeli TaxID=1839807 RepID=UPI001177873C|nr:hypothetical protein [Rappaport israeli]